MIANALLQLYSLLANELGSCLVASLMIELANKSAHDRIMHFLYTTPVTTTIPESHTLFFVVLRQKIYNQADSVYRLQDIASIFSTHVTHELKNM